MLILDEPTAALGVKEAAHVLRIVLQARQKGIAVIFITHQVVHALTVGDHFAVLIRGAKAADFRKGEKTREEITDLMAGGEAWPSSKPRSKATWRPTMAIRRRPPNESGSKPARAGNAQSAGPAASHAGAGISMRKASRGPRATPPRVIEGAVP